MKLLFRVPHSGTVCFSQIFLQAFKTMLVFPVPTRTSIIASESGRVVLLETGRNKPIGFQPSGLRLKGLASAMERPENWTADG